MPVSEEYERILARAHYIKWVRETPQTLMRYEDIPQDIRKYSTIIGLCFSEVPPGTPLPMPPSWIKEKAAAADAAAGRSAVKLRVHKKVKRHIPDSIMREKLLRDSPASYKAIYETFYQCSHPQIDYADTFLPKDRRRFSLICNMTNGLMSKLTGYSMWTVSHAIQFLLKHSYIERLYRAYPGFYGEKGHCSSYVLPKSLKHLRFNRIHHRR